MLTSIILRVIARSSDSLVAFITKLDARLDTFLAKHDADIAAAEQKIEDLWESTQKQVDKLIHDAEAREETAKQAIEAKKQASATVAAIKKALPTA